MTGLEVVEVRDPHALQALNAEWHTLWESVPDASVFQRPEWLLPWWDSFGSGALCTVAIRADERLVGLAPLYVYTDPATGERTVLPLGVSLSDHFDLLLAPGFEERGARAVLEYLADIEAEWDACDFAGLPHDSALLRCDAPAHQRSIVNEDDVCPVLALPRSAGELADVVPGRILDNVRYYTRRAQKRARMEIETAGARDVLPVLDVLRTLHGARWRERGERGVLADADVQRFHRAAAPWLAGAGLLRLYVLRLDDRPVAVHYGFIAGAHASYYIGGFDPEYRALSPGTLLVHHAMLDAIASGATEMDFLRGRERYKYLWGARDRPTWRRRLALYGSSRPDTHSPVGAASTADPGDDR